MVLEERLYSGEHSVEMYPAYLVLLTSGLGAAVTTRLSGTGRLAPLTSWPLHCIFASKLAMLLVPQVCSHACQLHQGVAPRLDMRGHCAGSTLSEALGQFDWMDCGNRAVNQGMDVR